jgi:hypothetical protein
MKLVELSYLSINMLSYLVVDVSYMFSQEFTLELLLLLTCFLVAAVAHLNTYSMEFEIQNINKWPTAEIIIRYTNTLRAYLRRKNEYMFNVGVQGYM